MNDIPSSFVFKLFVVLNLHMYYTPTCFYTASIFKYKNIYHKFTYIRQRVYIQSNIIPVRNNIVSVMQRFLKSQLLSFITREISQTCSTKKSHSFKRMNYITRHNSLNKLPVPFCLS